MPAVPKHRKPIVDAAVTLFRRQGYAGTGLNDIVDTSGAPKGSLYHYFPDGKASIAVAAVEEAGRRVAETMTISCDSSCMATSPLASAVYVLRAIHGIRVDASGKLRASERFNGCNSCSRACTEVSSPAKKNQEMIDFP